MTFPTFINTNITADIMRNAVQFVESAQVYERADSDDSAGQTPISVDSFENVVFPPDGPQYEDPFESISQGQEGQNSDSHLVAMAPGTENGLSPPSANGTLPYYKNGNGNGHRVLRSATVGYVAPAFEGKTRQMLQGRCSD